MLARALVIVLTAIAGVLYGFIGTVGHRASAQLGGISVPWGLVLALLGVTGLLLGLRLLLENRWSVLVAALGVLGTTWLLSLPRASGSILVTDSFAGTAWTITPTLIAVVIVGWPRLPGKAPTSRVD